MQDLTLNLFASEYRDRYGPLTPDNTGRFKEYLENADRVLWRNVTSKPTLADEIDPDDVQNVWRQTQGLY